MGQQEFWADQQKQGAPAEEEPRREGAPRWVAPNRSQIRLEAVDLEDLVPQDHPVRLLWHAIERLDLSRFYETIKARKHGPGRPPSDPKVLLALWLYAISEGEGSARQIERLTEEHRAYRWLRGDVPLNYHTLSDFRWEKAQAMDELLTQLLAVLLHQKLITLSQVSQDGLRVRASAGKSSFRRRPKLKDYFELARERVQALKEESAEEIAKRSAAQRAAQERAAAERERRVMEALKELNAIQKKRENANKDGGWRHKNEPRASSTDPQARIIKMPSGGYNPGYNVQLASDTESQFIVGVSVTNDGTDYAQAVPMMEQIEERTGQRPKEVLLDAGYSSKQTINKLDELGVTVYAAPQKHGKKDPFTVLPTDSPAVAQWRQRMASDEGKEIYKRRVEHERINADVRTRRTLDRMLVRGIGKVTTVAVLNVLTYNLLRWISVGTGA